MMAAEPVVKRMKNKNWNASETTILVERCVEGYSLLFGSHSPSVTEGKKDLYWKETIEMINAVGPGRSLHEAKRKWVDLKSSTKAKEKKIKKEVGKTGGGPAPDKLTPLEEKVLTVIPKASIEGVTAEGDVFLDNLKESSIEEKFETEEVQCTHNENKMVSLAENVAPLQLTENLKFL
ncbi:uncharacterized protein LOC127842825 isoform X1 [Dreissena polymorpha]|uniref:uncharacterized protein LOC127842825 isoform X1 n=1 Tax=Dreissena polymorpha TaxID=45954 RepID=UPI0022653CAF|nr:uncharacterized protein LOC127842825 isoform X1 [Dreissena polymorpha]